MKAYKGFNQDMTCRGFQFAEGQTYELPEGETAILCERGFHACEAPIDCLRHYEPAQSVYHEVELDGVSDQTDSSDSKRVGRKIKIGARLDVAKICNLQFEYVKEHCTNENNAEAGKAASAGSFGAASAGSFGAASAGFRGAASAGESGAASAGESGAASAGESGAASAGFRGAASAGSFGAASAGSFGAASAGESGAASSRGASSVGKNGIACVRGNGVKVRGGIGSLLVIGIENDSNYEIKEWKAGVVDGEILKPDVWYTVKDGEWVEAEAE